VQLLVCWVLMRMLVRMMQVEMELPKQLWLQAAAVDNMLTLTPFSLFGQTSVLGVNRGR
jgi:hypothetical protein